MPSSSAIASGVRVGARGVAVSAPLSRYSAFKRGTSPPAPAPVDADSGFQDDGGLTAIARNMQIARATSSGPPTSAMTYAAGGVAVLLVLGTAYWALKS